MFYSVPLSSSLRLCSVVRVRNEVMRGSCRESGMGREENEIRCVHFPSGMTLTVITGGGGGDSAAPARSGGCQPFLVFLLLFVAFLHQWEKEEKKRSEKRGGGGQKKRNAYTHVREEGRKDLVTPSDSKNRLALSLSHDDYFVARLAKRGQGGSRSKASSSDRSYALAAPAPAPAVEVGVGDLVFQRVAHASFLVALEVVKWDEKEEERRGGESR